MSIIQEFYRGQIAPLENFGWADNPDYKLLVETARTQSDNFIETLTSEQWEKYKVMQKTHQDLSNMELERMFTYAFRMGIQFGVETYQE